MLKLVFILSHLYLSAALAQTVGTKDSTSTNQPTNSNNHFLKQWPAEVKTYTRDVLPEHLNQSGDRFYNELFNAIDDLTIFQAQDYKNNLRVNSSRNIYDNRDIFNSWTVVDKFSINLGHNLFSASIPIGTLPAISLSLGLGGNINYMNIRRSSIKQYDLQQKLANLNKEVTIALDQAEEDIQDEEHKEKWYDLDPIRRAQYFEPLKRLFIPLRVPYLAKNMKHLQNGEIMAFNMSGTISLGAGVGFSTPTVSGIVPDFNAGLSYSTYLRGGYRYALIKEADNFVRLKVSQVWGGGDNISLGMNFNDKVIFDGFVVPKIKDKQGRQILKVTPFRFSMGHDFEKLFDVCYRYDLTQEAGILAYEEAMRGNLELSQEVMLADKQKEKPAVSWVFTRDAKTKSFRKNKHVDLGFLYQKDDSQQVTHMEATISLPTGESHVFRSVSDNSKEWKSYFGHFEKMKYTFSFYYNRELFEKKTDDSFSLIVEGAIDDYITSGIEMRRYSKLFEIAVGSDKEIFPRLPVYPPPVESGDCVKWDNITKNTCLQKRLFPSKVPAYYGRSAFYFRLGMNRPLLEKFIAIDEKKMWGIVEKAFGVDEGKWDSMGDRLLYHTTYMFASGLNVPFYLANAHLKKGSHLFAAEKFMRRFKKIQKMNDPEKRLLKLAVMFSNSLYGYEFVNVLRLALEDDPIAYAINATSKFFPNSPIRDESWGVTIVDHVSAANRRDMDFETYQTTITLDEKALVKDLKVTNLTVENVEEEEEILIDANGNLLRDGKKKKHKKKRHKKNKIKRSKNGDQEMVMMDGAEALLDEEPYQLIKVQVDVNFGIKPKYVYLKIMTDERWIMAKKVSELIIPAGPNMVEGPKTHIFTNEPGSGVGYDLLKHLKLGKPYRIYVSISQDGRIWGPVKIYSFRL